MSRRLLHKACVLVMALCAAYVVKAQDTLAVQRQRVMFWNVENAFWPTDDPDRDDDEFTPDGSRHWTHARLRQKLLRLTRVILAAGDGRAPMLVGLAEVEGDSVMAYWTRHTPLWEQHYSYLVTQGPDLRGIQTALLYDPADFRLVSWDAHSVSLGAAMRPTRQILHAAGRVVSGDTLDVLVCHLPSQLGGARQSQPMREAAHSMAMHVADSINNVRARANIIIMGDMNDTPSRRKAWWGDGYRNLMVELQQALRRQPSAYGSHKHQGAWAYLDQMIVNHRLAATMTLESRQPTEAGLSIGNPRSFALPDMLTDDITHLGHRPKRSFYGYQYEGGYSDHLPILVDLDVVWRP